MSGCREKFGFKVNDAMWEFYKRIGIVDQNDKYTENYGDPLWVYYQYRLAKGDHAVQGRHLRGRPGEDEGGRSERRRSGDRSRRADLGSQPASSRPRSTSCTRDAKISLWAELTPEFIASIPECRADPHPVQGPQRLHRPSEHRRDAEPGVDCGAGRDAGLVGRPVCPRARSSSPTA